MYTTFIHREANGDRRAVGIDPRTCLPGYADELRRLEMRRVFLGGFTEELLKRAGIVPGMRVLDVGCGVGDVSLLAAWLIGPSGAVLGIDGSAEAVDAARQRAAATGQGWVRFDTAEPDAFSTDEMFDAVIGRHTLMYLPFPAATLRRLRGYLRPGGIMVFQEMAMSLVRSIPDGPQFRQCRGWILAAFERAGFEPDMGGKLLATFLAAKLPMPQMSAAGPAGGGPKSLVYDYLAETVRSLLPTIERHSVASAAEVEIDTLAERLRKEAAARHACIMLPPLIGAWARIDANS